MKRLFGLILVAMLVIACSSSDSKDQGDAGGGDMTADSSPDTSADSSVDTGGGQDVPLVDGAEDTPTPDTAEPEETVTPPTGALSRAQVDGFVARIVDEGYLEAGVAIFRSSAELLGDGAFSDVLPGRLGECPIVSKAAQKITLEYGAGGAGCANEKAGGAWMTGTVILQSRPAKGTTEVAFQDHRRGARDSKPLLNGHLVIERMEGELLTYAVKNGEQGLSALVRGVTYEVEMGPEGESVPMFSVSAGSGEGVMVEANGGLRLAAPSFARTLSVTSLRFPIANNACRCPVSGELKVVGDLFATDHASFVAIDYACEAQGMECQAGSIEVCAEATEAGACAVEATAIYSSAFRSTAPTSPSSARRSTSASRWRTSATTSTTGTCVNTSSWTARSWTRS